MSKKSNHNADISNPNKGTPKLWQKSKQQRQTVEP